jgi:predicted GH43/DUF377 family glycosyl hydrolase
MNPFAIRPQSALALSLLILSSVATTSAQPKSNVVSSVQFISGPGSQITTIAGWNYAVSGINDGGVYKIWWCTSNPDNPPGSADHIYYSTSTDPNGLSWTTPQLVMNPAPFQQTCDPSVVKVGSTYYMYYGAANGGINTAIYLATSSDGINWTKYPNNTNPLPIIANTVNNGSYGLGQPSVLYVNNQFVMYYTNSLNIGTDGIYRATSFDGITFSGSTATNLVVADIDIKYDTSLNRYIMIGGGSPLQGVDGAYGLAWLHVSSDGLTWTAANNSQYALLAPYGQVQDCAGPGLVGSTVGTVSGSAWAICGHSYSAKPHTATTWRLAKSTLRWNSTVANSIYRSYTTTGAYDHFYSLSGDSPDYYSYEQVAYHSLASNASGATPFYRLRYQNTTHHFYTASQAEVQAKVASGWVQEGTEGYVALTQVSGTVPLYRLYNSSRSDYLYTTSVSEKTQAVQYGYLDQGVTVYVIP